MSMNSKQRWMGGVVLLGGGVLLAALLLKGKEEIHQNNIKTPELVTQNVQRNAEGELVQLQPLTVDVETEKRLLEQQRVAREKSVAEQEARAAEFLAMQQQAEADAARKAAEEYAALNAHRNAAQQSSDNIPPELVEDEKAKQQRIAADKAAEVKKLEQQKLQARTEAEKAAATKKLAEQKALAEKQALEDKAKREAEAKRKAEDEVRLKRKKKPNVKQMLRKKRKTNVRQMKSVKLMKPRKRRKLRKRVICLNMAISNGWYRWHWLPMKPMRMHWLLSFVPRAIRSLKVQPLKAYGLWWGHLKTVILPMQPAKRLLQMRASV